MTLIVAATWMVLTRGDGSSWIVGVPAVVTTVLIYRRFTTAPAYRLSLKGALGFVPFFLIQSIRGGMDVARRAVAPQMQLNPRFIPYQLRLPEGPQRVFFANSISLLPGTLTVALTADRADVHVLAYHDGIEAELRQLETRVAVLFGVHDVTQEGEA